MTATRRIPVIAAAAALLLIVVWYFLLWSPQSKNVKAAHKAHAAAEQKISDLQSQAQQLQALVKQIPQDNAKFAQLQASLPDNPQLDQAVTLLHQAALQAGVTVVNVAPTAPAGSATASSQSSSQSAGGVPAITLTLSVQGNPAQVKTFLAALGSLPRTFVVDKVSLSSGGPASQNNAASAAAITARVFYAGQPTP